MSTPTETRPDPLAPIEFAVVCISAFLALVFVIAIPFAVFGGGSVLGLGDRDACAVVDTGTVPYGETGEGNGRVSGVLGLHGHTLAWSKTVEICNQDPSPGVKAAATAGPAAEVLLLFGFLALTLRLIRGARRHGLFTTEVASHTRTIGWYLVGVGLTAAAVDVVSRGIVVASAIAGVSWTDGLDHVDMPWTLLIAGLGIITFARVLRHAVTLQDDVDATI